MHRAYMFNENLHMGSDIIGRLDFNGKKLLHGGLI